MHPDAGNVLASEARSRHHCTTELTFTSCNTQTTIRCVVVTWVTRDFSGHVATPMLVTAAHRGDELAAAARAIFCVEVAREAAWLAHDGPANEGQRNIM